MKTRVAKMIKDMELRYLLGLNKVKRNSEQSAILDLTSGAGKIAIYPFYLSFSKCNCHYVADSSSIYHCPHCGSTLFDSSLLYPSFDFYSSVYKLIDILSPLYETVSIISDIFIPTDFVGSLNSSKYLYVETMPHRRNIIHIKSGVFSYDEVSLLTPSKSERVSYLAIFSSNKEIKNILRANIVQSTDMNDADYLNLLLSSCGVTENHNILCSY